jgi:hypothetical protein
MRNINTWVYDGDGGVTDNWQKQNNLWTETTYETYWQQCECLPPSIMTGSAFMMGEPYTHTEDNFPIYAVFMKVHNRYFSKNDDVRNFNPSKYTFEIMKQFGME